MQMKTNPILFTHNLIKKDFKYEFCSRLIHKICLLYEKKVIGN